MSEDKKKCGFGYALTNTVAQARNDGAREALKEVIAKMEAEGEISGIYIIDAELKQLEDK